MKIEKLGERTYRVRKTVNGQLYTHYFDYKPTEREIISVFAKEIGSADVRNYGSSVSFKIASDKYIDSKSNVLSPSTIREYSRIPKRLSDTFIQKKIDKIEKKDIQAEINLLSKSLKPKTVKDYYSYIVTIIKEYRPNADLKVTLPQRVYTEPYIPTKEEVIKLIEDSKTESNGMFFVPIVLASYGFRRSEILSLQPGDIDENGIVRIDKARVQNINKEWVDKTTKTEKSTRTLPLPQEVIEKIQEQGYVYNGGAQSISNYISRWCEKNGVEHFSIHKLRHYFATQLIANGADHKTLNYLGGWSSNYISDRIYTHNSKEKISEQSQLLENALLKK